jgi:hypothetical protein
MSASVLTEKRGSTGMKTVTPRNQRPPALPKRPPKLPKAEEFPPINIGVLHGRVIECFEAKIPIVHGGGATVRGYGGSWVGTTVHNELSCWFVNHQTGQQHKIDFGGDYLDMRIGHDVTMLWANDQLYAINNHTTNRIKYPGLRRAILPEKIVGLSFFTVAFLLFLALFEGFASLVFAGLFLTMVHGPWSQLYHHQYILTQSGSNLGLLIAVIATVIIGGLPFALLARGNAKNRAYNQRQANYLTDTLRQAEEKWIRRYAPPRGATLR